MTVNPDQRRVLEEWATGHTVDVRIAHRCRIVLALAVGCTPSEAARQLRTTRSTVRLWRDRFLAGGPDRLLYDKPGRGRKPAVDPVVWQTIHRMAESGHASSTRQLADSLGISMATVTRWRRRMQTQETSQSPPVLADQQPV
ncbi:MAG TPA: helix-turn-helix domain-containing protein [Vicinamibacterales bacterium]|nr:helix-turn-helix domain-containing protein [Vicinamibacterales bacterium]